MPLGGFHVSSGQSYPHPEKTAQHGAEGEARSREHHPDVCQLFSQGEELLQRSCLIHLGLQCPDGKNMTMLMLIQVISPGLVLDISVF